jgi:hypothetical protein
MRRLLSPLLSCHIQLQKDETTQRRLLPPFNGCRIQRQKEDTAHAQAIAASFKLSRSAPEGGHGACAGYCRLL